MLTLEPTNAGGAADRQVSGPSTDILDRVAQIDYEKVLAREEGEVGEPAKRDDLWRSIVMSIARRQSGVR